MASSMYDRASKVVGAAVNRAETDLGDDARAIKRVVREETRPERQAWRNYSAYFAPLTP